MASRPYRRLFFSTVVVIFGIMGQAVARGWLAHDLTGSNTGLGGVMLAFGTMMLLATPWGGVAADRLPKRLVLFGAVITLMLSSGWIGLAVAFGWISYWMLVVASGLQAAAFAFYLPARIAMIVELVERADVANGVMLAQVSQEGVRVGAPALAGVLIGLSWFGLQGVFLLSAALSAVSSYLVWSLPKTPRVQRDAEGGRSPIGEFVDAVRYVRARPGLSLVSVSTVSVVMIGFPYLTFLPALAEDRFDVGAFGYGIMSGCAGMGAVGAGLITGARHSAGRRPWVRMGRGGMLLGAGLAALGLADNFEVALVALVFVGAGGLLFQTTSQALMLTLSDFEFHGRMQSMVVLGFSGFGLAALPLGLLADAISLRSTLVAMGAVATAIAGSFTIAARHRVGDSLPVELA